MDNLEIDYKKAAQQLRSGEALFGKDGALAPMLERILNAALEGEMDAHLNSADRSSGNRRNGKMSKTVQTKYGEVTVETPRDRDGSFKPETVKKRETILAEGMADQIINMYALGTSTRDISKYFEREFNTTLSAETISSITDRVIPEITAWKSRMLDPVYAICWLDAIHYKVKDDKGRAVTRAIYNVLGINKSGHKDLLGMYISESEGANFWLDVMTDLQNRGVRDILKSWRDNWERLTEYFQYTPAIRKLIYTTNTVEGYHRQVLKVTKNKGVFPSDTALEKLVYLAYRDISGKWTMPLSNWALISQQLAIKFGDRFKIM